LAIGTAAVDGDHVGLGRDQRDRREPADVLLGDGGGRRHHQRVAVGGGVGDLLGADPAARAGPVLDHHRLPPERAQLGRQRSRQRVGAAGRRERHDDGDGARRKRLRRRAADRSRQDAGEEKGNDGATGKQGGSAHGSAAVKV
jgi:hypothetical protein